VKAGDLVVSKRSPEKILGVIMHLYEILNPPMHPEPLPMAQIMTRSGLMSWKRRKLKVINESR
jgi:hypothetical protein